MFQPVVLAIIENDGTYLLTKRNHLKDTNSVFHDKWQIPGGKMDFGESVENALRREIKEELGVKITIQQLLPNVYHRVWGDRHYLFLSFVCHINPHAHIVLNEEATESGWFTLKEVKKLDYLPFTYEVICDASRLV